jgi:hypothetical protein
MKMADFDTKVKILSYVYVWERENPALGDFGTVFDIGLPLAYFLHNDVVTLKPEVAEEMIADIERTYGALVTTLGLDPHGEYDSFREMESLAAG